MIHGGHNHKNAAHWSVSEEATDNRVPSEGKYSNGKKNFVYVMKIKEVRNGWWIVEVETQTTQTARTPAQQCRAVGRLVQQLLINTKLVRWSLFVRLCSHYETLKLSRLFQMIWTVIVGFSAPLFFCFYSSDCFREELKLSGIDCLLAAAGLSGRRSFEIATY